MLSIGNFSKICNVSTKTLRHYDEIDLLKPAYIDEDNGYRYYKMSQLKVFLLIKKLKEYQLSLEEIRDIINQNIDVEQFLYILKSKKVYLERQMNNYQYIVSRLDNDISNIKEGIDIMSYLEQIEVSVVERESIPIISVRESVDYSKEDGFYKVLEKCYMEIQKRGATPIGAPMAIYHGKEFIESSYDTEIAVPILEDDKKSRTLEGGLCAMGILKGPYSELQSIYAQIRNWIEKEEYTVSGPMYDIYLTNPCETKPEDYVTEVYFPIIK